jgi:Ubiquitin-2 like Rad60 SUMO-like
MLDSAEVKQQRYAAAYKLYELAFPPTPVAAIWPTPAAAAAAAASAEAAAPAAEAQADSSRKRSAAAASLQQDGDAAGSSGDSDSGSALKRAARTAIKAEAAAATAQDAATHITSSVSAGRGEEVLFKTKTSTRMLKVFNAYATHVNKVGTQLKFYGPDWRRIDPNWTLQEVGLVEGDEIDVLYEQEGC